MVSHLPTGYKPESAAMPRGVSVSPGIVPARSTMINGSQFDRQITAVGISQSTGMARMK